MTFPRSCTNCQGKLYGPVAFCPFCGTRVVPPAKEKPVVQTGEVPREHFVMTAPEPSPLPSPDKGIPVHVPEKPQEPQTEKPRISETAKPPAVVATPSGRTPLPDKPSLDHAEPVREKKGPGLAIAGGVAVVVLLVIGFFLLRQPGGGSRNPGTDPAAQGEGIPIPKSKSKKSVATQPPPTASAEVKISTNPPGAIVAVDGTKWGISPAYVKNLPPGQHIFDISKSGFRDERINVTLAKGDKKDLQVSLASFPSEPNLQKLPSAPFSAPTRDPVIEVDLAEAIRNFDKGKLDVAIVQLEAILRRDKNNKRAKEYLDRALAKRQEATDKWMKDIDAAPVTGGRKR